MPLLLAADASWTAPIVMVVGCVCAIAMLGLTLRWAIRLGTFEARIAAAEAVADLAAQNCAAAHDKATEAMALAKKRVDSVVAMDKARARQTRRRDREEEEVVLPTGPIAIVETGPPAPMTEAAQVAEVEKWYRDQEMARGGGPAS